MNLHGLTISAFGDDAVIIDFGNKIDEMLNRKVLQLFHHFKATRLPFVKDIVPGYSSLVIFYDLLILANTISINKTAVDLVRDLAEKIPDEDIEISGAGGRKIKIPVCYSGIFAPDIDEIATGKNISVEEVINIHTSKSYRVYMIGFLPGFAYMGEVDPVIEIPRKIQPRTKVHAGSIGIAGKQTGIYPLDSPGGWQIIGRTPLRLFDKNNDDPVLLRPGDEVEFYSISENEFTNY